MKKQEIQTNIQRLEKTISMTNTFQKSYIENCKKVLESYKTLLASIESEEIKEQEEDAVEDLRMEVYSLMIPSHNQ